MPKLIGLCGRAGSGKSYVADQIVARTDYKYAPASFAAALRWEIEEVLGSKGGLPALWDKPTSEPVRFILQKYGTDFRRAQDPDYWVKKAFEIYEKNNMSLVFQDVRFPNEAQAIRDRGGLVVRVLAPIELREKRLGTLPPDHASETSLDDWPVDMHITSTEENPVFDGQLTRILIEATVDEALIAIKESLDARG